MLTIIVVDDVVALVVIAVVYSDEIVGRGAADRRRASSGLILLALAPRGIRYGLVYFLLGRGAWVALFESGVDPVVLGLADRA